MRQREREMRNQLGSESQLNLGSPHDFTLPNMKGGTLVSIP